MTTLHFAHRRLFFVLVLLAPVFPVASARATVPFELEVAHGDFSSTGGTYVSLALGDDENPHVAYSTFSFPELYYSHRASGVWVNELVDTGNVGYYASLGLDPAGNPHISYRDSDNQDLLYATRVNGGGWSIETVDAAGDVGMYTSIVIDAQGRPHISYYDATNGNLKYARKNADLSWTIQVVDNGGDVGLFTSIALDPSGLPHISYYDQTGANLKYARDVGGLWVWSTVATTNDVGKYSSLVIDPSGYSHVSFIDDTFNLLYYARRNPAGTWTLEPVDIDVSVTSSIGVDPLNRPRICYYNNSTSDLRYASRNGTAWTIEKVDDSGVSSSLALDSRGSPHIAYSSSVSAGVRYADSYVTLMSPTGGERWRPGSQETVRWVGLGAVRIELSGDGGATYQTLADSAAGESAVIHVPDWATEAARVRLRLLAEPTFVSDSPGTFSIAPDIATPWWMETPDTVSNAGFTSDIALDPQELPHITHFSFTTQRLRYLSHDGGGWSVEIPDTTLGSGGYSSLVFDPNGDPHVSHWNFFQQTLSYSVRTGGVWSTESVDAGPGNVGVGCSLALLGTVPAISYQDNTNGTLKLAYQDGGWQLEVVDPSGNVGEYTSLALDSSGRPHIAYNDQFSGDLRYAFRNDGPYVIDVVDAVGDVGYHASLALDADDVPHIAYYDATWEDLKYATKRNGVWKVERVDTGGDVGTHATLTLDPAGNPVVAYSDGDALRMKVARRIGGSWSIEYAAPVRSGEFNAIVVDKEGNVHASTQDANSGAIRYVSSAIELTSPAPGDVWPVGSSRIVRWNGSGRVNVSLSVDGGNSYQTLATNVTGGAYGLIVPHQPSAFTRIRVERAIPRSTSSTPGLFTIETDIVLLMLSAAPPEVAELAGGAVLSWATDPGPEDLGGYRLEKDSGSGWATLAARITDTSFYDASATPGARYRLFGINGLGEELELGEVRFGTSRPLLAGPLPYRGGDLRVSFTTFGGLGGGYGPAEVALFDLQGRRVKIIASGTYPAGTQEISWNGTDDTGRPVASGVYFIRSVTARESHGLKIVIVR